MLDLLSEALVRLGALLRPKGRELDANLDGAPPHVRALLDRFLPLARSDLQPATPQAKSVPAMDNEVTTSTAQSPVEHKGFVWKVDATPFVPNHVANTESFHDDSAMVTISKAQSPVEHKGVVWKVVDTPFVPHHVANTDSLHEDLPAVVLPLAVFDDVVGQLGHAAAAPAVLASWCGPWRKAHTRGRVRLRRAGVDRVRQARKSSWLRKADWDLDDDDDGGEPYVVFAPNHGQTNRPPQSHALCPCASCRYYRQELEPGTRLTDREIECITDVCCCHHEPPTLGRHYRFGTSERWVPR